MTNKTISTVFLLLLSLLPLCSFGQEESSVMVSNRGYSAYDFPRVTSNSYAENKVNYELVCTYRRFKGDYRFSFVVEINDHRVKPSNGTRHELTGCWDEFGVLLKIDHILSKDKKILGWTVDGLGSICGNTRSYTTFIIIPFEDNTIQKFEIDSKAGLSFNPISAKQIEVWYYYQEWGQTGTAGSFFVPKKQVLVFDAEFDNHVQLSSGDLYKNIDFLNKPLIEDYLKPNYPGLFSAGLNAMDPDVLKYAFENHYKDEYVDWYKKQGLPVTLEELSSLIGVLGDTKRIPEEYKHLVKYE